MQCTCIIRNELNRRRQITEAPVYTENKDGSKGVPYMPRMFPFGVWNIVAVLPKTDPYEAPLFISTDAFQRVDEWTEGQGHYGEKTGTQVEDYGYGLHNSTSLTTLGCGRITKNSDLMALVGVIKEAQARNEPVTLVVR
jgi:hypothetical protein